MALVAHFTGNWRMDVIKQDPCLVRAMGIMARSTWGSGYRIIHVLPRKSGAVRFVTVHTEGNRIVFQKMIKFGRGVRIMTVRAPLFHRVVFEFNVCDGIPHIFMAAKAKLISRLQETGFMVRSMRVMAFCTIAFHNHLMDAAGLFGCDSCVTLETDLIRICKQDFPMGRCMRVMTP